ncbi:MAG: hypothetical protein KQJ78_14760 [Deltaproteobacteria bacterium]|nr:hypothetical protein [Deltaproteobacteria bacterium]
MLRITFDAELDREFTAALRALGARAGEAVAEALNRGALKMRGGAVGEIRRIYNVPVARLLKKRRGKGLAVYQATSANLTAGIKAWGGPVPLIYFGARPNQPVGKGGKRPPGGVSFQARRDMGRTVIPGAFIAPLRFHSKIFGDGVNLHVARRETKGGARLPVRVLRSYSIPNMLKEEKVREAVLDMGYSATRLRLASNIRYLVTGQRKA